MKEYKRTIAIIIGLVMCLSLLSACGNNETPTTAPSAAAPSASPSSQPQGSSSPSPSAALPSSGDQSFIEPPKEDESVKYADHIEVLLDSNIAVINPTSTAGSSGPGVNSTYTIIYDRIVEFDEIEGRHVPALATSWETDDWQTITFKLRDDVYFHNGDKFTAHDVVYSVMLGKDSPGTLIYSYYDTVDSVTAIDDYTVVYHLKGVNAHFLYCLDLPMCVMFNKRAIEADPIEGFYIGTGAYKVTGFSTNDYVTFERNEDYWGVLPITKTQRWRFVPEVSTRSILLQNKDVHVAMQVAAGDIKIFRDSPEFTTFMNLENNATALLFNMKDPICGDINFRKAVAYALNKEEIAIVAMEDMFALPTDGSIGWGYRTPGRNTSIPEIQQDIDKAKQYLADSVYNGEELEISTARVDNVRAMEAIQEQLARIGIKTRINEMDQASFLAYATGMEDNGQLLSWVQVMQADPSSYRNQFYERMGPNRTKYVNHEVMEMLDKARTTVDFDERREIYMKLQEMVAADIPAVPLYFRAAEFVAVKGVGGVLVTLNATDFRNMYMVIED